MKINKEKKEQRRKIYRFAPNSGLFCNYKFFYGQDCKETQTRTTKLRQIAQPTRITWFLVAQFGILEYNKRPPTQQEKYTLDFCLMPV